MGSGKFSRDDYLRSSHTRALSGVKDFAYSEQAERTKQLHQALDPRRINKKPFGSLESRDSDEHPNSNAIMIVFDVTGSNYANAVEAQKKLPELMDLLSKCIEDPQVAIAANDDFNSVGKNALQISDFESDNRIDDHIRNVWLVACGGGNDGESYDLAIYAAARKTILDCLQKRDRKGYFFMYADESIFGQVRAKEVELIFDDHLQADIPIEQIIQELKQKYHTFVICPKNVYPHAREKYVELFGEDCVIDLAKPKLICNTIGAIVQKTEKEITDEILAGDLAAVGASSNETQEILASIAHVRRKMSV